MAELIAVLSSGEGTWMQVEQLIKKGDWDKIFIVTNELGKKKFSKPENAEFILIDQEKSLAELTAELRPFFKEKINSMEVSINLISGSGKEHMAVLSAVMSAGLGFRLVAYTKEGIKEF